MSSGPDPTGKQIVGYLDRWSARPGESVTLHASSHQPGPATIDLVRLSCGDPTRYGPGFREHDITAPVEATLADEPLRPGSFATFDLATAPPARAQVALSFAVSATRPALDQTIARLDTSLGPIGVDLEDGRLVARFGSAEARPWPHPIANRRWYHVTVTLRLDSAGAGGGMAIEAEILTRPSASPARDLLEPLAPLTSGPVPSGITSPPHVDVTWLDLAGDAGGGSFDGRIGALALDVDDVGLLWDASIDMESRRWAEVTGHGCDGELHQLPTRAVTGPSWDGTHQRWSDATHQWDAVHFHRDDLYDAGWPATTAVTIPPGSPSGIYAVRVRQGDHVDRVPVFVRPALDAPTNDVALLMSSATYLAYANHHMLFEGADFIAERTRLRPEHEYIRTHPDIGLSMYEKHPDGSGVMFSSRLRPVLNLRPGADGWNFTPDTDLNAFLEHELGHDGVPGHDVINDEDLDAEGLAAIASYRVIVTCTHPEYWSTAMLDALAEWQRGGGRLMYLGGNGFYWRVAFSPHWPGAMELRRAEDGVRNWQPEVGEYYHAWEPETDRDTGRPRARYGGMWRRNGRSPNEVAGVGFAAQGFDKATAYTVNTESRDGTGVEARMAWAWHGVIDDDGRIGTSGLGGGAAGQEVDRYDQRLGSPAHAVVLASATVFEPDMVRTKEEFEGSVVYPVPDPYVRSDIVLFETPGGGATFSVGSISWFGALARNDYDNDVARLTANVLHRFRDPAPFDPPPPPTAPTRTRGSYS